MPCGSYVACPLPALELHKNYAYFQKFLPGNAYDTRVTVIGNRAFGYRRYTRDNDFRSSGSGKIDYDPKAIDLISVEIGHAISKKLCFQSMAYDFLYDENGKAALCEMSYNFVDEAHLQLPWSLGRFIELARRSLLAPVFPVDGRFGNAASQTAGSYLVSIRETRRF